MSSPAAPPAGGLLQNTEESTGIIVSFSGGKTSGRMARILLDTEPRDKLRFAFMNTGCEEEETLRFVDRCDREWSMDLVVARRRNESDQRKGHGLPGCHV